jgi:hypothetical protein
MAGGLAGLGQGIAAANTDTLTFSTGSQSRNIDSSKIPQFAGGVALSQAATEWQEIIRRRIDLLVPVVQVLSGREATAVFSQSLAIPDLLEQVDQDPSVVYASLD